MLVSIFNKATSKTYTRETRSINSRSTSLTRLANSRHPLDSHAISNLDCRVLCSRTHLYNLSYTLVATYLPCLRRKWQRFPGVRHNTQIGMTNTGVREVDQDFACAWLGHFQFDNLGGDGAGRIIDGGFVFGREGHLGQLYVILLGVGSVGRR